jgi:CBS domain-containing protein
MIVDPVTIGPDQMIGDALEVMRRYKHLRRAGDARTASWWAS